MKELKASEIAEKIEGKLKGPDKVIKGIFNILKDAKNGDAVIRHWIDEKGVEIAAKKGVSCLITQSPKDGAVETAEHEAVKHEVFGPTNLRFVAEEIHFPRQSKSEILTVFEASKSKPSNTECLGPSEILRISGASKIKDFRRPQNRRFCGILKAAEKLGLPLIITERIELASAFAIKWAINKFARNSLRVVVTGTNGKSTTAHMIYSILNESGYSTYTNTDSKSEFNTLIDPMVSKQIAEFEDNIEAMVIEVSEVQGWLNNMMQDHAFLMTSAVDPDVVVITNVALDHIGLVNSIEETYDETSGAVKALKKENGHLILNSDDPLVKKMENLTSIDNEILFFGKNRDIDLLDDGISYKGDVLIKKEDLPFKSNHFIQNTMAAVGAALSLKVDPEIIRNALKSYTPLNRRFTIINKNPCIIDDFAHNPDGIKATIKNAALMANENFYVVSAIRGSRGEVINQINAEAIAEGLKNIPYKLIITSSSDVVDDLNMVKDNEKKVFMGTLQKKGIKYIFYERLYDALENVLRSSKSNDTILLIGAQGMDPANGLLNKILDF